MFSKINSPLLNRGELLVRGTTLSSLPKQPQRATIIAPRGNGRNRHSLQGTKPFSVRLRDEFTAPYLLSFTKRKLSVRIRTCCYYFPVIAFLV